MLYYLNFKVVSVTVTIDYVVAIKQKYNICEEEGWVARLICEEEGWVARLIGHLVW